MNGMNVFSLVESQEQFFLPVLSDSSISWAKEKQFAIQLLQNNNALANIAMNNQVSLQNAIINVASIGISLNPANKHAYLVPRDNKVCLDISYMGLLHLAMTGGSIKWGQCKLVMEGDDYQSNGLDKAPSHKYNPFSTERDVIIGAYCTVKTMDGSYLTQEMKISEINDIKDKYAKGTSSKYSPWVNFFGEMARKTVVKRAAKYWPAVKRLNNAIRYLNNEGGEGIEMEPVKAKSKVTRAGMDSNILPPALCQIFGFLKEAYDAGDLQVVIEKLNEFDLHEERQAVYKCFASNERAAIKKFDTEGYVKVVNQIKIQYLEDGEELDKFLEKFSN
jgi:recombination protein RecT